MKAVAASPVLGGAASSAGTGHAAASLLAEESVVKLFGDGLALSPEQYVEVLQQITGNGIEADYYSRGGIVEALENDMAAALGKERAIYFPTGTLANHVAIRALAGERTRALVPAESHIYNDSGDCVQQLSQLNLIPLVSETATFTLDQVQALVDRTEGGRVETGVGVIVIESPVRRKLGELFDYQEMKRISSYARDNGIRTHLDGARLYMASGYTGISPKEYASHFDTVYVSLWKYFNAGSGAILAGSEDLIAPLYHTRRMFGGGLPAAWQFAAVALHFFETFEEEFRQAVQTADAFFSTLKQHPSFDVVPIARGSNIFKLIVQGNDLESLRARLKDAGVLLSAPRPSMGGFVVSVNATWNRRSPESLTTAFTDAVG